MKLRWYCFVVSILMAAMAAHAQPYVHSSVNGKFAADDIKGCPGLEVGISYPDCDGITACGSIITNKVTGERFPYQNFVTGDVITFPDAGDYLLEIVYSTTGESDMIDIFVTPAIEPNFQVALCTGNTITTEVTSRDYAFYIFDFDDGTSVTLPANSATTTHTYTPPPTSYLLQVRGYNGDFNFFPTQDNCPSASTVVDLISLDASSITQVEVLNTTSIQVDFLTEPHIQYKLAAATNNASSFAPVNTILDPVVNFETIASIRPDDNYYCFRLDTYDACTNTRVASSTVVCSVVFDAIAANNQNELTWNTALPSGTHPSGSFTVVKEGIQLSPTLPPNQFAFTDTEVICNMDTSYQLIINYPSATSISLLKNVTSFSSDVPTAITDITANVTGTGVDIDWLQDPAFTPLQYDVSKIENGITSSLGVSTTTSFSDTQYQTTLPTCYTISYQDVCLNASPPGTTACPVQLNGTLQPDNTIQLIWSDYSGWQAGVQEYLLSKYDDQGNLLGTFNLNTTSFLDDQEDFNHQTYVYVVTAIANNGALPPANSNQLLISKQANVYYPSAFTPNNDALNDTFHVFGQYIVAIEFKIFNRWGELMYETTSLEDNGWNGLFRGALQPEGAYVFTATLKDQAGNTFERSGSFYLMRKK